MEQDNVTPVNGWKAYYAATRAIVNINSEFFNVVRKRSLPAMSRLWLNADYVKCFHASGEYFTGYDVCYLLILLSSPNSFFYLFFLFIGA